MNSKTQKIPHNNQESKKEPSKKTSGQTVIPCTQGQCEASNTYTEDMAYKYISKVAEQ